MRNALALAGAVLAITASCSRPEPRQPDPGQGYMLETTGAVVGRDDPWRNAPEDSVSEAGTRLASQICEREARCHGRAIPQEQCMRVFAPLTTIQIEAWSCSPAASRARAKECIASLNAEPCEMDLSTKPEICPSSDACPDETANLIAPGAAAARPLGSFGRGQRNAFNRAAAGAALGIVDVTSCRSAEGPTGTGHIDVTFAPDGGVLTSRLDRGPDRSALDLHGTPKGECVIEQYRKVRVPLFDGQPKTMGASFTVE